MVEEWRAVVSFEGEYEVSDLGRVRSLDRIGVYQRIDQYSGRVLTVRRQHAGRMLRPGQHQSGHLSVVLGRGNTVAVHILVLEAFVGPCPEGKECLHGDDVPSNNRLTNLRWGTRSENLADAVRNGRKPIGEQHHMAKLKAEYIPIIRAEMTSGRGSAARLARTYGVADAVIWQVVKGKTWRHIQ